MGGDEKGGWGGCPASFYDLTLSSGTECSVPSIPPINQCQQSSSVDYITKPLDGSGQVSEGRGCG